MTRRLVLASASPGRLATLRAAGVEPDVLVSGVNEDDVEGPPAEIALELARRKASAVAALRPRDLVLGCDSVLDFDGASHGKPATADEAAARWRSMRGREGVLHTGHCLAADDRLDTRLASTRVRFAELSDAEIDAYVATGEPLRVAGAFTLDALGGWFLEGIDGSPSNVVGLSLPLLRRMLADHGVGVAGLWATQPTQATPPAQTR